MHSSMMYILLLSATGSLAASIPRAVGAIQNTTQEFKLQAVPKAGLSGYKQHEGLWLQSYHTGAGENDVVLRPNETQSNVAFLNYTEGTTGRVIFNPGADYPSGFVAAQTPNYAAWTPMNINSISPGDQGFFFNESGLQWNGGYFANTTKPYNSWAGWLVCDWWHAGLPQLFWLHEGYAYTKPDCCTIVDLVPKYL